MTLRLPRGRSLHFGRVPLVVGIVNVTPDSFSNGGVAQDFDTALRMEADGAAIVDVGGESTRPGSDPVSVEIELDRVIPVIEAIRKRSDVPISIDTTKARVAEAALDAGADAINDVTALCDPAMRALAAQRGVPVVLMHMRGAPKTMQHDIHFDDVVRDVARELCAFRDAAIAAGVTQTVVDPGIGFGKTAEHNLQLLARASELTPIAPLMIGASRKAFIGRITGRDAGPDRMAGSLAAVAAATRAGAALVRVHDVRETVDFLKVLEAIGNAGVTPAGADASRVRPGGKDGGATI